jgi:hypothetical protein
MINKYIEGKKGTLALLKNIIQNRNREQLDRINYIIPKLMTHNQQIQYGIYSVKQVLYLYEQRYLNCQKPDTYIAIALKYIRNPSTKNKEAAFNLVRDDGRCLTSAPPPRDAAAWVLSASKNIAMCAARSERGAAIITAGIQCARESFIKLDDLKIDFLVKVCKYGLRLIETK